MGVQIIANAASPEQLVEAGVIPGFTRYKKFGRSANLVNGQWTTVWDGNTDYDYPTVNLVSPTIVSTDAADTGIVIVEAVDEDFNYRAFEVQLNGLTPVPITGVPFMQPFRMESKDGDNLAGTVTLAAAGTDYAIITNGDNNYNQSQMAIMVVPKGFYGLVTKVGFAFAGSNTGEINYRSKSFGEAWKTKRPLDINEVYSEDVNFFFDERTLLDVRAKPSNANTKGSAWFDIILVKTDVFHRLYGEPKRFPLGVPVQIGV